MPSESAYLASPNLYASKFREYPNQAPGKDTISHMSEGQHNCLFIPHVISKNPDFYL